MWWNSLKPQFYVLDGEYGPVKERASTKKKAMQPSFVGKRTSLA